MINVKKRNGRGTEPLNIDKIHEMVEYACEDISGVSSSQVEMNADLQFYDNISTNDIQQILIKSASDLISLESPNYQYVASRLLLYSLRKQIFHRLWDQPHFSQHIKTCVDKGVYDKKILESYEKKDFDRMYKVVEKNYNIVIWPEEVKCKDINEMIQSGLDRVKVKQMIDSNTFSKLEALTRLNTFKKC